MRSKRRRLLIPAVFVAAGCTPAQRPCTLEDLCGPDGGHYCFSDTCGVARNPDGGVRFDDQGNAVCLC